MKKIKPKIKSKAGESVGKRQFLGTANENINGVAFPKGNVHQNINSIFSFTSKYTS